MFFFLDYINSINSINAINDNLPDDLLNDTVDFGLGGPPSSSSSGPMASTSAVGSIAPGGGPPQVVVASSMGMNNGGGSTLNGITTTNCVQSQPMMTSTPQMMGVRAPSTPNINLVNALQGAPGSQQGNYFFSKNDTRQQHFNGKWLENKNNLDEGHQMGFFWGI